MRQITVFLIFACLACGNGKKMPISKSEWIIGTWKHIDKQGNVSYETWKKISDKELNGKSYVIIENDTTVFEELILLQKKDSLFYIAKVKGHNDNLPVCFSLKSLTKEKMKFENLQHDFPQKISYQNIRKDSLIALVYGIQNGVASKYEFLMKRVD